MSSPYTRISLTAALAIAAIAMVPRTDSTAVSDTVVREALRHAAADTTLAEGAFTEAQVTRGEEIFSTICVECHDTTELGGEDFMYNWEGSSVGRLFRTITSTMPESDPGGLPTEDYLAVISYILQLNGFPAGESELTSETELLNGLRIEH